MTSSLSRRVAAEFVGTLFLLAAVVGSGIMGERLSGGNVAIALLANTLATGTALVAIILAFGPISGSHLNPAVTLVGAWTGEISWRHALPYIAAQTADPIDLVRPHVEERIDIIKRSNEITKLRQGQDPATAYDNTKNKASISNIGGGGAP